MDDEEIIVDTESLEPVFELTPAAVAYLAQHQRPDQHA